MKDNISGIASSGAIYIRDVKLAAALATMGAPIRQDRPFEKIIKDGQTLYYFYFQENEETRHLVKAWSSPEDVYATGPKDHPLRNPEHPFWYVRAALRNRDRWLDEAHKAKGLHIQERYGKTFLFTKE